MVFVIVHNSSQVMKTMNLIMSYMCTFYACYAHQCHVIMGVARAAWGYAF